MLDCKGITIGYFTPEVEALFKKIFVSYEPGQLKPPYPEYIHETERNVEFILENVGGVALTGEALKRVEWLQLFDSRNFSITIRKEASNEYH